MNMSEDVTAVSMQVTEKAADAALSAFKSVLDSVGRLFRELLGMEHDRARAKAQMKATKAGVENREPAKAKSPEVSASNLTDIRPGEVGMKELADNARALGDSLAVSEHGLTQEDKRAIARKAKQYGIPIAFTNAKSKNNIYANVRSSDLPIFRQICTECIKAKIAENPEALGNFKCQKWEIPYLTAALKAHDLPVTFVETKNGELYCLHDVKQKDAVRIVREEFVQACKAVEKDFSFDRDEEGFYTLKDLRSGREISFDEIPDKASLAEKLQTEFGYDETKANLAAAKFGEKMLNGKEKQDYFRRSAQNEFSHIDGNVTLKGEKLEAVPFGCWYLRPKKDEKPRIVFRGEDGKYAILEPLKMSQRKMREILTAQLGVTDRKTLDALIEKAERVAEHYAREKQGKTTIRHFFQVQDWNGMPEVKKLLTRTDPDGNVFTKVKPLDYVGNKIKRTGLNTFTVHTTFESTESNAADEFFTRQQHEELEFTFSDKKRTLHFLEQMYQDAGMPPNAAKKMAKEVYHNAELQSPETVLCIEQVTANSMTVAYGKASVVVPTESKETAIEELTGLGVSEETAESLVAKAEELKLETVKERVAAAKQTDFVEAMNHMVKREERNIDTMIICSAVNPEIHISVEGSHNGTRVVHDYTVFNGEHKVAAFSDADTTDTEGNPIRLANGTSAWMQLKRDIYNSTNMTGYDVLVFENMEQYQQYLDDLAVIAKAEQAETQETAEETAAETAEETMSETETSEETAAKVPAETEETLTAGNGHESHPEGNILENAAAESEVPFANPVIPETPEIPSPKPPELPSVPRGARR